jgi:Predicted ATPases
MLNSLEIKNFRMLEDFSVSKLGRVNLIVGKNNSGKSTVLEALRIYAGNAQPELLDEIANGHDEKSFPVKIDQIDPDVQLPFEDLFTGRQFPQDDMIAISIGEQNSADALRMNHGLLIEEEKSIIDEDGDIIDVVTRWRKVDPLKDDLSTEAISHALFVSKDKRSSQIRLDRPISPRLRRMIDISGTIPCSVIPTQFISVNDLANEWDNVVFTDYEDVVIQALKIVSPEFENITFVRKNPPVTRSSSRSAKVKIDGLSHPVPLNSMGDGMQRVLQLVLKIFPAKGGFLLIDEFENGLHYSIQEKVWNLLFEMSQQLDIQVFVTTHSWDCIESFSKVAIEHKDIEGVLFRVGKSAKKSDNGKVIATVFDEDALYNITQAEMEVR